MTKKNTALIDSYSTTSTDISTDNYAAKVKEKVQFLEENILNRLNLTKESKILDIGCGWGGTLSAFKQLGYTSLYGFDLSKEQIDYAKNQGQLANVEVLDAIEYLKKSQESFECICMFDVLEHLENDYAIELLELIKTRLNTGGRLIIQVPNGISFIQAYLFSDITHIRSYTSMSMTQILTASRFTKYKFYESYLAVTNFKQWIANMMFRFVFRPFTMLYILSITGSKFNSIYTANMITIVTKD